MRRQANILAILLIAVVLLGGVALSGCTTGSMNVSPTPVATENPTAAATATPTTTASVTVTAAPTATPTATPTMTPTASPTFSVPPWVDYNSGNITTVPSVMTTFTSVAPGTYPYNGEVPPWVELNIQTPAPPVLVTVTGNVENPLGLTWSMLHNYPIIHVHATFNKKVLDCDGASLNAILNDAKPKSGATSATFTGSDGRSATVSLDVIAADNGAAIAFTSDNGLRIIIPSIIPTTGGKSQVSNVTSIQVQ